MKKYFHYFSYMIMLFFVCKTLHLSNEIAIIKESHNNLQKEQIKAFRYVVFSLEEQKRQMDMCISFDSIIYKTVITPKLEYIDSSQVILLEEADKKEIKQIHPSH